MKHTAVMKNWSITRALDGWTAPELVGYRLQGYIYSDTSERFRDGDPINTSKIMAITEHETFKTIETKNTVYTVYPDDIDPEYERQYPGAYERLNLQIIGG